MKEIKEISGGEGIFFISGPLKIYSRIECGERVDVITEIKNNHIIKTIYNKNMEEK